MIWFYLDGVDSRNYGIYLRKIPDILSAEPDIEFINIPGRTGTLTMDHGGYKDADIALECYIRDIGNVGVAHAFLSGSKKLVLSTNMERSYKATFYGQTQSTHLARTMQAWEMIAPVRLKPFRYFEPEAEAIAVNSSLSQIDNPGSAASAPRITLKGSGDVTLIIGLYTMEFSNLSDGIIIDSDKMRLLNLDGTTNALEHDVDEFPLLEPGANHIQWTGLVSDLTIEPRWRDR